MTRTRLRACGSSPRTRRLIPLILIGGICLPAFAGEWQGNLSLEGRAFPSPPYDPDQLGYATWSFAGEAEYAHEWLDSRTQFVFSPYGRWDAHDEERTHADIRKLYWMKSAERYELRLGIQQVFWGVTESMHLVDIINQMDMVDDISGDRKLGQPMVNLTLINPWGNIDFYVMPGFRRRTLTGEHGRFRTPVPVTHDHEYEAANESMHTDLAVRYSHYFGSWDVALSHFYGTSRSPRFLPQVLGFTFPPEGTFSLSGANINNLWFDIFRALPGSKLTPYYDLINQTGVELQWTGEKLVWKFEGIWRSGEPRTYAAAVTGFEYPFNSIFKSTKDLYIFLEYIWDSRGKESYSLFQNDIFVGGRLAFNDTQSTTVQAGWIIDPESGGVVTALQADRRLRENLKLAVELRMFSGISADSLLTFVRKDDMLRAELTWYF